MYGTILFAGIFSTNRAKERKKEGKEGREKEREKTVGVAVAPG